jgi:phosphoribosylamine--glycine ligase
VRVLLIGAGGREHALAWKIHQSPRVDALLVLPGSDAMDAIAERVRDVAPGDPAAVAAAAAEQRVDLVVVGPEDPLAAGVADHLRERGIACFGPSAAAARLESSKSFAKAFMARHRIPTAGFEVFDAFASARDYVRKLGGPCVVKADGLAAGKGVAVCDDADQAEAALVEIMEEARFGEAGARVVIEERMVGEEASYYAISDGVHVVPLAAAQDHKRALDGDAGENTGGMGAYSPTPVFTPEIEKRVLEEVVHPTIRGMADEGAPYVGVLYVGLMIEADGTPRVVEFNVRFGDPETQPLLVRMEGDLVPLLDGAARGTLERAAHPAWGDAAVCVVLASGGYPRSYETGKEISGLDATGAAEGAAGDVIVFHAGTGRGPKGVFETRGGRVLGVTARGPDVKRARARAYEVAGQIRFDGRQLRRDIADRVLGS